jgi:regulatory protein
MKIISVKQKNKQTNNCIVTMLDEKGESVELELSMDLVVREQLSRNMEISDELRNKLISEQRIINAKQVAFSYISARKRTINQVINKLKEKNFAIAEINFAVKYLCENNLLDDEIFAKSFVKDTMLTRKIGRNKIFNMLYEKGISKEIIVNTLNKYFLDNSLETAVAVAERKYNLLKNKQIEKIKQSLFNHLISKGFSFEEAKEAINIVLAKHLSEE